MPCACLAGQAGGVHVAHPHAAACLAMLQDRLSLEQCGWVGVDVGIGAGESGWVGVGESGWV